MGRFSSARRRSRQSQAEHRHCLLQALAPVLSEHSDGPRITGAEQGLHLCLRLPSHVNDRALAQRLAQQGLTARPLSAYCLARKDLRGLVIGRHCPLRPGAGGGDAARDGGATGRLNKAALLEQSAGGVSWERIVMYRMRSHNESRIRVN